jgi:hypothetical protein
MDLMTELTVKNLTPPGYFNLSADAEAATVAYTTWWNNILAQRAEDAINLKTLLLTPWLYDHPASPRTPWLQYLLTMCGVKFFSGTNNQAAYLYRLLSSAWSLSTVYNIMMILQTFALPPFSWFTLGYPVLFAGNLVSSLSDTGFIIYSTAASPGTPTPTAYVARAWSPPASWTKAAASAVKYSRGYLSGGNIVWCAPRPVADFKNSYVFSAAVPIAIPSAGTVAIVYDDGSGDIASVYYSDGAAWRKSSTPNADLGLVNPAGGRPSPEAIAIGAPDPATVTYAIDSQIPPPIGGPTRGYGTFATGANNAAYTDQITINITQITGGTVAIATLIELLRRVKPVNKLFHLFVSGTQYIIYDTRQKI